MRDTPLSKLEGRYTSFKTSGKAIEASNASLSAIQQYNAQVTDAEAFNKMRESLSPEMRKLLDARIVTASSPEDDMRIKCAEFVLGVRNTLIAHLKMEYKDFASMTPAKCQEMHDEALLLYKMFPHFFPTEGKSN